MNLKLTETQCNGVTPHGLTQLELFLHQHRNTVHSRYNGGTLAQVLSLELRLNHNAQPVRAKPRRYPPEKEEFLQKIR